MDTNKLLIIIFHLIIGGIIFYIGFYGKTYNKKDETKEFNTYYFDILIFIGLVALVYNFRKLILNL